MTDQLRVGEWRAQVTEDFIRGDVLIRLAQRHHDSLDWVTAISPATTLQTVATGVEGPEPLRLTRESALALRDGLNKFLGPLPNDYRARYEETREALVCERARVDGALRARVKETVEE